MYSEAHQDHSVDVKATGNIRIDLKELSKKTNLTQRPELVHKLYIKSVQFTMDGTIEQQRLPRQALPSDICYWYVTPSKHQAYATFWFYLSGLIGATNAYVWLIM